METNPPRSSTDIDGPSIQIAWKDEQSILAKWHMPKEFEQEMERKYAIPFAELPFVLRLFDVTDRNEIRNDGTDLYTDFDINHRSSEWILYGVTQGLQYCVDLGIRMVDGRFYSLSRSQSI
ncbi:DUF4912 domain-containing protein [Brevibacillus composti]|uniref:DUF4912 domain-containing protein n=1 Tax=Brevibacillus composti TaxID=2796470 RepID=A0A7T5ENI1_9BACL|nr:DUF4912 domain-containing protein [Brevibacillus composti]QQE75832.1 DUF4912 domain-containing protein [Brevibacillus composti]QUO42858.1 DUF4912 domain-containing protein [Brevibacillus composti]